MAIMDEAAYTIDRHKTAIRRTGFSLPVNCLLRDQLLHSDLTFFDYGCGRGQDLDLLSGLEIACSGWDPVHRPEAQPKAADVVNLGYVINVIEDKAERTQALQRAWSLSNRLLVVSAQLENDLSGQNRAAYADGYVSSRNTFQKYFSQSELRAYIDSALGAESVPAAPGVFFVFKDEEQRQQYLVRRYRRSAAVPRRRVSEALYEHNRDILDPFMEALARLGRLPEPVEFDLTPQIINRLGSLKRAFAIVKRVTEEAPWEQIAARRREDLLVYLALSRFGKRPVFSKLPAETQRDVKAFAGTYSRACAEADALLFSIANTERIDQACQSSTVGHLVDNGLLIHRSVLPSLDPLLRTYEGCARALVGEVDEANVIKLHRFSGKVTYLSYRDFQESNQPHLATRIKVGLRDLSIGFFDYSSRTSGSWLDCDKSLLF